MRGAFRLLVCGGRDYADRERVFDALDRVRMKHATMRIAQGGADGADALARAWAEERRVPCGTWAASWDEYGRAAGPLRNQQLLNEFKPEGVIAFPGGAGTEDMVRRARAAGVPVWIIKPDGE